MAASSFLPLPSQPCSIPPPFFIRHPGSHSSHCSPQTVTDSYLPWCQAPLPVPWLSASLDLWGGEGTGGRKDHFFKRCYLIFTTALQGPCFYAHFTDVETEAGVKEHCSACVPALTQGTLSQPLLPPFCRGHLGQAGALLEPLFGMF